MFLFSPGILFGLPVVNGGEFTTDTVKITDFGLTKTRPST
jgi:hypothetical protein